jgi:hypothetical protein
MKSLKSTALAILLFCVSGTLVHALIPLATTTYEFHSDTGEPTIFDGSIVTLGVPPAGFGRPDVLVDFDIINPHAVGGHVTSFLDLIDETITAVTPDGWIGSFVVRYTEASGGGFATNTVVGELGPPPGLGNISDTDPHKANGVWTALAAPDQPNTMVLLGLTTAALSAIGPLRSGARRWPRTWHLN